MSESVISVENIWKEYRLGVISHGTFYKDVQSWWARKRGKEDPNLPVDKRVINSSHHDRFWALQDISFEVQQGDVLGIIGKNGAGKSTLLKVLSSITSPTKGRVRLTGRIASLLEVGTGFHPELTGRENVYLNGAILGMTKKEIDEKFDDIVAYAEVKPFIDTPVKRYSSGMYVRLAFAVAAHLDNEILILDEVLAVGDANFQRKCLGSIQGAAQSGRTIIFVSHSMTSVSKFCNKAIWIEDGKIKMQGKTNEIIEAYIAEQYGAEENTDTGGIVVYETDASKKAQICKVAVMNEGNEPQQLLRGDVPIRIEIDYAIYKAEPDIEIECHILTSAEEFLLSSYDTDLDKSRLGVRAPGIHRTGITIPANMLNSGIYYLWVAVTKPGRESIDSRKALAFRVDSTNGHIGTRSHPIAVSLPALLAFPLKWD